MDDQLREEFAFVRQHVLEAPHNTSSWSYLRGLASLHSSAAISKPALQQVCDEVRPFNVVCSPAPVPDA